MEKATQADIQHWEKILSDEGLSLRRGLEPKLVVHVQDTDSCQVTKTRTGSKGGRLVKYALGGKLSHRLTCKRCLGLFDSKRADAKTCSPSCRKEQTIIDKFLSVATDNPALKGDGSTNDPSANLRSLLQSVQTIPNGNPTALRSLVAEMDSIYQQWRSGIETV